MKINITLYQTCAGIYVKITTDILVPLLPTRGSSSLTDGSPSAHLRRLESRRDALTLPLTWRKAPPLESGDKEIHITSPLQLFWQIELYCHRNGRGKKVWLRWVKWWTTCCKLQCWVVHNMCCTHEGIHRWGVSCFKHRHCWQYEIH